MPQLVGLQADGVHLGPAGRAPCGTQSPFARSAHVADDGVGGELNDEVGGTCAQQLRGAMGVGESAEMGEETEPDGCRYESLAPSSSSCNTQA